MKMLMIVIDETRKEALEIVKNGVDKFCATCGERLRMISWEVESIV